MSLPTIWTKIQPLIQDKVGIASYESWFSTLRVTEKDAQTLTIEAPDEFFKNWLVEHYQGLIEEMVNTYASEKVTVEFAVNPDVFDKNTRSQISRLEETTNTFEAVPHRLKLNTRFTFENFVIGPSNRFACAAGLAVAESPARAYNPLFVYGPVGLGKTHLIQSITHKVHELHPQMKVSYLTSEQFTNELIDAIRHRSTANFRKKYREIDVLLIDDIQFIAGKESTQEEFFHTFNYLHDGHKQIIITSDRPPHDIANLEERLRSRFAWGLITDIQPPTFETRVAILRKKIENETIKIPDDVIYFIAEQISTNIRELEGALIRVVAYSQLGGSQISLELTKHVLKDMVKETTLHITIDAVQKTVAQHFNISLAELRAKKRQKNIVLPRQIAMYLSRELTNMSLPEIGNAFGGKDHTTVLHSCKKIEREIHEDASIRVAVERLTLDLKH